MPFALAVVVINALVTRDGATVVFRGPSLPWPGQIDITLEAIAYGGVLGLRILAIFGTAVFFTAAVDADELLRALRRVSLRSGVTAALAMRLFGVLRRDAHRLADAQRCLPGGGASRLASCTRSRPARSTARPTSRRRSRCAASASARRPPRMHAARGRATTTRSPPRRSRCSRSRSACSPARGASSTPTRASRRRSTPPR